MDVTMFATSCVGLAIQGEWMEAEGPSMEYQREEVLSRAQPCYGSLWATLQMLDSCDYSHKQNDSASQNKICGLGYNMKNWCYTTTLMLYNAGECILCFGYQPSSKL